MPPVDEQTIPLAALRFAVVDYRVCVAIRREFLERMPFPQWLSEQAFEQLCLRLQLPTDYLKRLPATLVCQLLNHELGKYRDDDWETAVTISRNNDAVIVGVS